MMRMYTGGVSGQPLRGVLVQGEIKGILGGGTDGMGRREGKVVMLVGMCRGGSARHEESHVPCWLKGDRRRWDGRYGGKVGVSAGLGMAAEPAA